MNKYILFFFFVISTSLSETFAQEYSTSSIPDSLKKDAHCVIRSFTTDIELSSVNSGIEKVKEVITILDKEGEQKAYLMLVYDKNSSIDIKSIKLFDRNGKKIRTVKQYEISEPPAFDGCSLVTDEKVKIFIPQYAEYPYSVEYEYETKSTNIINYAHWNPINKYNVSVQQAKLSITHSTDIPVNKKEIKLEQKSSNLKDNKKTETWELNNFKALEEEPFSISLLELTPQLYLMPSVIQYDKHIGSAQNWQDYGKWVANLFAGRDELSSKEKPIVAALVANIPDTLERIKVLYKYMQKNTRYVGIQLGIGGYQPFDAKTVYETGYGDCKALSNYMHAILKSVGIKSYPTLASAGEYINPILKDFPNFDQFNHCILCVLPNKKDTLWLECTDQKMPATFIGTFTDDRDVLLITENGGEFAHTKIYDATENIRKCNAFFTIDSLGTANCKIKTTYEGLQYNKHFFPLLYANTDEQKKMLYKESELPSLQIKHFSINNCNDKPLGTIEESSISKNYGSFASNYMLLPLNRISDEEPIQKMLKSRFSDILISRSSIDYDTLSYQIPQNYQSENIPPKEISIHSKFGEYSVLITTNENNIIYTRKFLLKQGHYNKEEYKEFYNFMLEISKADNTQIMLSKKN